MFSSFVLQPGFLQGLVPREYSIERGVYCCNDPFGLVDIWCDVETGGKMMARAIDSQGDMYVLLHFCAEYTAIFSFFFHMIMLCSL